MPGVDFTNVFARIFRARFSYKCLFSSYVLQKTRAKNVGEIDPRSHCEQVCVGCLCVKIWGRGRVGEGLKPNWVIRDERKMRNRKFPFTEHSFPLSSFTYVFFLFVCYNLFLLFILSFSLLLSSSFLSLYSLSLSFCLSICVCVYVSLSLSLFLSLFRSFCLSTLSLSFCLSICVCVCLSFYPSFCLSLPLSLSFAFQLISCSLFRIGKIIWFKRTRLF